MARNMSYSSTSVGRKQPIHLIVDFDGTLTRKDTMYLVGEVGYSRQEKSGNITQPRPWKEIVDAYLADLENHTALFVPKARDRHALEQEKQWLNSLEPIEKASISRALEAGIFNGVQKADVVQSVRTACKQGKIEMRNGWFDLFSHVWHRNAQLSSTQQASGSLNILSVTWSACFVTQALQQNTSLSNTSQDSGRFSLHNSLAVYANELPSIIAEDYPIDHCVHKKRPCHEHSFNIRTSGDKMKAMQNIISTSPEQSNQCSDLPDAFSIYIGDSPTDLECLCAADIGICIRDEPMRSGQVELAETCERIGLEVRRLKCQVSALDMGTSSSKCLFWVTDFVEIRDWLIKQIDSIK